MTPTDTYLLNQIAGASPEKLHALLLGGAYKFTYQLASFIEKEDIGKAAQASNRLSLVIEELLSGLNNTPPNELATNLTRIYLWWLSVALGSGEKKLENLKAMMLQIKDMKEAWEASTLSLV